MDKDIVWFFVEIQRGYVPNGCSESILTKRVQDPNSVGAALRTISLRLRGTSVSELEEAGEDTTGVVASKSKLRSKIKTLSGVDILTDTGAYKSTYQVLLEISKIWKDMSDVDQAALLELIAGKNRANTAMAILSNTKDLEDAYVQSLEAEGSAYAENEKYLDSIQGKIDQFNNAVQTMWNNTLDDSVVKGFVEFGTIVVKVIDKIGLIPTLLSAVGITKILPSILKAVTGAEKFTGVLKAFAFGAEYANNSIGEIIISTSKASATAAKNIPTWVSLGKELGGVKGAAIGLTDGLSKLWATIPAVGKIMLIAAAIGVVVAIIDHFTISVKEAAKITSEAISEYKQTQDSLSTTKKTIESISDDYEKLSKGVDEFGNNINLTTDEYKQYNDIVNQIADMFPEMVTGWTKEGNAILSTKGNVEALTRAYEENARAARDAILSKSNIIFKDFLNDTTTDASGWRWNNHLGYADLEKVIQLYIDHASGKIDNILTSEIAGEDYFGMAVEKIRDAIGREGLSDIKALQAYLRQVQTEARAASSNVKTVLNAYLQDDFDYAKLSDSSRNIVNALVSSFDTEFYNQFDSATEMYAHVIENVVKPLQHTVNAAEFEATFDMQTKFNNGEVSIEEYQSKINGLIELIDALDLDKEESIIKAIKVIFDIDDYDAKINVAKDLLDDKYDDKALTLTKEDLDIVDKYASEWKISDDILLSWDELKSKIEATKEITEDSSITDSISKISSLEDAFNSLGDAVKEFKEDGTASASTLKSLSESFGEIEGFEELYKVLATGEGNVEEAITNVANAYIAQKDLLSDLSEEELQIMVARLESLGVINAQEILLNRQTLQQELDDKLQGYNIDLSAYSTVEQAKEAIANTATMNICSAVADMETELQQQYGINLSDFVSTEEAKVTAAKKAAKEIAKANKEAALSDLSKNTELTDRQYLEQQAKVESDYRNTLNSIDSIDSNLRQVVDSVSSTLDSYYNQSFKFDFSGNKVGIGRDYKDIISDKNAKSALEKLKKKYENKISLLEAQQTYLENEISRLEASDQQVSRDLYDEQIKLEQQKLKLYEEERKELLAQMSTVAKDSDEWHEYAQSIWEVEHAIQETTISIVELQKKIAQLYIDVFNKIEEAYGREQSLHDKRIQYLEDEIELLKLRNEYATISPETYNQLNAEEDAKIQSSKNEVERLKALLQKGIDENGQILTEEQIYDMLETIYEKEADIRQSEITKAQNEQNKKQAYLDRFNNTSEAYDNLTNVYQGNYDNAEYYKKYADLYGISIPKEILDYQTSQLEQQVQVTLNKKAELERQLAEAIASGDIKVGDSQWLEMVNAINDCTSVANEFQYQIAEVAQEINALSVEKFNDIKDAFSNVNDVFNDRQSYIEEYMNYLEALGITVPAEMYEELIANEKQRQASNMASIERLRNQLAEMEANGYTAEDDEWVQAQADIRALEKEVLASETAMAQWNKTIQEMSFEKFDEFLKRIQDVCDELENVYGLISDEDVALEDGSWTEEGIMSLGLMTQKMAIAKEQAAEYAKEIEKLNEEYKNGNMSEQDYYDRLMELKNGQWESINAYKDAKDAIIDINEARIDMIEQGIQKEIDAYTELIDLKKKELDAERDLYNFRKDIKSQTKDIATLERKIAAMLGSTDAATIAQRSKLEAQLREARESLNDTYYNHANDSISNAYDDELDSYTKSKEDYVEQLREALENVEQVVADSMAQVLINADSILTGLNDVSSEYGVTLSDYLMLPWQNAALQANAYKESGVLDLADFTEQTGIYSGIITEQINTLFGNGSLAAGLFQTSIEGVVESISVTVNEATSPLTSDLQLPWETVKDYAQNTFAPEVMYALQSVADDVSGKKEQLTNDLIAAFQAGVENAETFNAEVIDALQNVIEKSDYFADVVPPNVSSPSANSWDLWSSNVQSLIQGIIDKANDAVNAINNMNAAVDNAQGTANTISNIGTSGGSSGRGGNNVVGKEESTKETPKQTSPSADKVKALQEVLNIAFNSGIANDGKYGPATKRAVANAQNTMYQYGIKSMKSRDGLYGASTRSAMISYINSKINSLKNSGNKSSIVGQGIMKYQEALRKLPTPFYAKGTLGTKQDQWAITDEPQYGDELVLIPSKNGNLSYMRKGTSVVPANLTKKLIEIAQSQTGEIGNNLIKVSIPNVAVNNNIELSFDTLLRVENATQEAIPELKKLVQEQLDIFSRKLNYGIKRVGGVK